MIEHQIRLILFPIAYNLPKDAWVIYPSVFLRAVS